MLDLTKFKVYARRRSAPQSDESYITTAGIGSGKRLCCLSLSEKVADECIKYLGNQIRVYVGEKGEMALARGDKRLSVKKGRGIVNLSQLTEQMEKDYPGYLRVHVDCEWDEDADGNTVLHIMPTGRVDHREDIVGRRLEVSR